MTGRAWMLWSLLVAALASAVDVLVGDRTEVVAALGALGVGLGAGALHGLLFGGLSAALRRMPRPVALAAWPMLALVGGAALASELGAWARLEGKDRGLALAALALSFGGGLLLGLFFAALQPSRDQPRGFAGGLRWRWRGPLVGGLVVASAGALLADQRLFVDGYAGAHLALRLVAYWLAVAALGLATPPLALPRLVRWGLIGTSVALVAVPFFTLRAPLDAHAIVDRPLASVALGALRGAVDFDRDGYASLLGGGDCAGFDGDVGPDRPEIPANGIDDNCLAGDGEPVDAAEDQDAVPVPTEASPVNVLLVTIDTLAAGRTTVYGHKRDTTPHLARFAQQATVFEQAYTAGGWTSIALASLMRGLFPRRLQWKQVYETNRFRLLVSLDDSQLRPGEAFRLGFALPIDDPHRTMAQWLERRGVWTAAVVDDGYSQFLDKRFMGAGFARFRLREDTKGAPETDRATADAAIRMIKQRPKDRPFFLWVHFFGPHGPSTPVPGAPPWGKTEPDRYDAEIWGVDRELARVLEAAEKASTDRPLATIVTADHGEHVRNAKARDHGHDLLEESIRVPLVIKAPGFPAGARVKAPVTLADVMPTVLALTGTPGPRGLDGIDLAPAAQGQPPPERLLVAETWRFGARGRLALDRIGVFDGRRKLVLNRLNNDRALFDQSDLGERPKNLLGQEGPGRLGQALDRYLEQTGGALRLPP